MYLTAMKRRAAEIAAVKLCNSSFDKPFSARTRCSRSSSADKTQDKQSQSLSGDRTHNKKEKTSSKDTAQEKKVDITARGQQTGKCKSAGSEDSVDSSRRSSLRSSYVQLSANSRPVTKKPYSKKNDTSSASSSDTDADNDSTDTELSQPAKQRKIGIGNYLVE